MANIIIQTLRYFKQFLQLSIFIRAILSWLPLDRNGGFYRLVLAITDPILAPIQRAFRKSPLGSGMMIDFSPVIAYLFIDIVYNVIVAILV